MADEVKRILNIRTTERTTSISHSTRPHVEEFRMTGQDGAEYDKADSKNFNPRHVKALG